MKRITCILVAAGILCGIANAKSKLSPDLRGAAHTGPVRVVIQWNANADLPNEKIASLGGSVISEFQNIHSGAYLIPYATLDQLSKDSAVKHISVDRKVHRKLANAAAAIGAPIAWKAGFTGLGIGVAIVDSGINTDKDLGGGKTAIYQEDFTLPSNYRSSGRSAHRPKSYGVDWYGHGQHIAGIIASNGKSSDCFQCFSSFVGIAPNANLIDFKVLDRDGNGDVSAVIAAIDRAIELKSVYNIRVMNLSLGQAVVESFEDDPLCQAAEAAWKAGIVVVVSAGNEGRDNSFGNQGYSTITSPGNDPFVITVGAMKSMGTPQPEDDLIASYSSKGPTAVDHIVKPDILAPGNQIISLRAANGTLPLRYPQNIAPLSSYQSSTPSAEVAVQPEVPVNPEILPPGAKIGRGYSDAYFTLSGTSMAAAVVSGAVADLLQSQPGLTPDQVKMLLMRTASKTFPDSSSVFDPVSGTTYVNYYDLFTVGAGYLNLPGALAMANQVPSGVSAFSPAATYEPASGDVQLVFNPSSVFADRSMWGSGSVSGDRSVWGSDSIWGSSILNGNRALWGSRSLWGSTSTVETQRSMWGVSGIWSDRSMWGSSTAASSETILIGGEN